jgi:crossover junction endodeoxyribonuclease RuvC
MALFFNNEPRIILGTAVGPSKKVQDFEPESLAMGVEHSQMRKATHIASDSNSKDCACSPDPIAVSRIILGIDPGTITTGYALVQELRGTITPIDFGLIRPPQKALLSKRYLILSQSIRLIIEQFKPTELAIETPFVQKNPQSALKLGGALACALVAATEAGMEAFGYSPREVKKSITGNGASLKEDVESFLKAMFRLEIPKSKLDATDALSIAVHHAQLPSPKKIKSTKIL